MPASTHGRTASLAPGSRVDAFGGVTVDVSTATHGELADAIIMASKSCDGPVAAEEWTRRLIIRALGAVKWATEERAPETMKTLARQYRELQAAWDAEREQTRARIAVLEGIIAGAPTDSDLELLAKLASGEGGARTGELKRRGYLE